MISLSARTHIALGLASIVTTALLLGIFAGLLPDRAGAVRHGRVALAESIAATSTALITANDRRRLESVLRFLVERNDELLSVAVRDARGDLFAAAGEHSPRSARMAPPGGRAAGRAATVPPPRAGIRPGGRARRAGRPTARSGCRSGADGAAGGSSSCDSRRSPLRACAGCSSRPGSCW